MEISPYPRPYHRLAPDALRRFLMVPIPVSIPSPSDSLMLNLADLNEGSWKSFDPQTCRMLATAIIEQIRIKWTDVCRAVRDRPLASNQYKVRLDDLELTIRTHNCLRNGGFHREVDLSQTSFETICELRNFGAASLVDLLTSLETYCLTRGVKLNSAVPDSSIGSPLPAGSLPIRGPESVEILDEWSKESAVPVNRLIVGMGKLRLPKFPSGIRLIDLALTQRAMTSLRRFCGRQDLAKLNGISVGDLLKIPGFGTQTLIDFLAALGRVRFDVKQPGQSTEAFVTADSATRFAHVEDELRYLATIPPRHAGSTTSDRNADIAARFYGLDGNGGKTLSAVASEFGITKERVRQICMRVKKWFGTHRRPTPKLIKARRVIRENLPGAAQEIEAKLHTDGISGVEFRLEGIGWAFKLLGHRSGFTLEIVDGKRIACRKSDRGSTRKVIRYAEKIVSKFGVATIADIAAGVSASEKESIANDLVQKMLESRASFSWLDRESGWFWLANGKRNRVVRRITKILSVCKEIDVSDLRAGISRHYEMKGYAPPRRVLLELCRQLPAISVAGTVVSASHDVDWKSKLQGVERTMVQTLLNNSSVLRTKTFEESCLNRGIKRSTFYAYLSYSPLFERLGSGVYGLRGAKVAPGVVESLASGGERRGKVRLDHGWTAQQHIWVSYRVSEGMLANGNVTIPGSLKEMMQGEFQLQDGNGKSIGKLVVKENHAWGLSTFFSRRGGEAGDILLAVFELSGRIVKISIGNDELLEPFSSDHTAGEEKVSGSMKR